MKEFSIYIPNLILLNNIYIIISFQIFKMEKKQDLIIVKFNSNISNLFKLFKKKLPRNLDMCSYRNKLKLIKWINPNKLIESNKDGIWRNREHIINKDINYLYDINNFNIDDSDDIKMYKKNSKLFKKCIDSMDTSDIDELWSYATNMLQAVIEYETLLS